MFLLCFTPKTAGSAKRYPFSFFTFTLKLEPTWLELAKEVADVKNLVIAKMDGIANEVDGIDVNDFPALIYYPADKKTRGVKYEGAAPIVRSFVPWLKAYSSISNWDKYFQLKNQKKDEL